MSQSSSLPPLFPTLCAPYFCCQINLCRSTMSLKVSIIIIFKACLKKAIFLFHWAALAAQNDEIQLSKQSEVICRIPSFSYGASEFSLTICIGEIGHCCCMGHSNLNERKGAWPVSANGILTFWRPTKVFCKFLAESARIRRAAGSWMQIILTADLFATVTVHDRFAGRRFFALQVSWCLLWLAI